MKPKWKYLIISAVTLILIAGWISLEPVILVLAVCFGLTGFFFYAIARLFWAVVHRLER